MSHHMNATFGGVMIAGGAFAYFKKGSLPSLLGGAFLGGTLLISSYMIKEGQYAEGHLLGAGISGLGMAIMGLRVARTGKVMPAGLVCSLSAITCAYNFRKYTLFA